MHFLLGILEQGLRLRIGQLPLTGSVAENLEQELSKERRGWAEQQRKGWPDRSDLAPLVFWDFTGNKALHVGPLALVAEPDNDNGWGAVTSAGCRRHSPPSWLETMLGARRL
ncbi:hypothetical protein TREES_T100008579 [Tupaia chinensis]|uniref:Uncharacterized protein n=1 Tax=Tupaia chinensis TaxID=246437 RepID=L9L4F5_TUPCH|nr:hypothetical protein TREES_T100008579 [Tupaia chinensis]